MKKVVLILLALAMVCTPIDAKSRKKKRKEKEAAEAQAKQAAAKKAAAEKPSVDRPGMFHVTKKKTDWFWEIPDSLIGRDFLATTRFTSTPANSGKFGGEEINEQCLYFEVAADSQLVLRTRLFVNVSDSTQKINKAITISNENPILAVFKVESHKNKTFKIKVNGFLSEDNVLTGLPKQAKSTFQVTNMLPGLSFIEDIKSFPLNTETRMVKTYNCNSNSIPSARETGRATFGINLSIILLPEKPMLARYYDPRVGYFTVGYNSYNDDQQRMRRKIFTARWRLEPRPEDVEKMKAGELVEPIKPIVYYIDPATPKQWRKYLIQGVNDWQKAFEQAGFKNAIYALEWPEGEDSIMSMEDARYSVIRYLASPIANAYGPHVSDPRSGEILESHICWYHNVMSLVHDWYMVQASSIDEAARKMNYDEKLMGQLIRFVSSHEVGHTLGLRHNFGASSTVPVDSLRNKAWVEAHGHTPSIMDYARFNYVAQPEDHISHAGIFPRINDYDFWAIKWGYTPMLDANNSDEDHQQLEQLFKKENVANRPRLWWGDGETSQDDPRRQTEDLGDDAMKASAYGIKNLKREIVNLPSWTYDKEDIYNENVETMYGQMRSQFLRYMNHVIRNIGGQLENYKTNDQSGDVYRPQPRAKQKAALEFIKQNYIDEPTWLREVSYAKRMTNNPQSLTLPIARSCVTALLNRLTNLNETYTAKEYLNDLTRMIMTGTGRYKESMQTNYVEGLIKIYKEANTDNNYRAEVLSTLKRLKSSTGANGSAHMQHLNDLIARALVIK